MELNHRVYSSVALTILGLTIVGPISSSAWAKSYVDDDGNRWDPSCTYGHYDGPCLDVNLITNEPAQYGECDHLANASGKEVLACEFGVDEARRMAIRYGGGYGKLNGFLRGYAWGMNKEASAYSHDDRQMEIGRGMIDSLGQYLQAGVQAGEQAGTKQGENDGSAEARARFAAAMDGGALPSDQVGSIPATNYQGEDNAYERHVRNPKTPEDILKEDLADLDNTINGAYSSYDQIFMGDVNRASIWDMWFGDGVYQFETQRWMDKDLALKVWLERPIDTKPKYQHLNDEVPMVPVTDPTTGKPVVDPTTGKTKVKPAYDLQALFRQSFVNAYNYYISYYYSKSLYDGLDQGEQEGSAVGIELGKRMAQQNGLIEAFNQKFKASSQSSFRAAYEQAYPAGFNTTYADYRDNPKLEVLFDGIVGAVDDGILQPGEEVAVRFRIRNYGGKGTPLKISLKGDVTGGAAYSDKISALSSKEITTPVLARIDNRLQNGDEADLILQVNDLPVQTRREQVRRQVELSQATYRMDTITGSGDVRVTIRNVSTTRTAGQVSVNVEVAGVVGTKNIGFLSPGESKDAIIQFNNVDPLSLIRGEVTANVAVVMSDETMATGSLRFRPADRRVELAKYYNQLVNGRGFIPGNVDRETRAADLVRMIVDIDNDETTDAHGNPWKHDPLSTMVGLVVNEYKQTTQTDEAKTSYKALGSQLWAHRKHFFKFLFFRSPRRKAYEGVAKQLPH